MLKWYMTENVSIEVLQIVVLIFRFLLYFNLKDIDRLGSLTPITISCHSQRVPWPVSRPGHSISFMLFWGGYLLVNMIKESKFNWCSSHKLV